MTHVRVELPEEVASALEKLANEMHSTPEALLRRAAEGLVTDRAELTARIERGLAEVSAGQLLPHDQVMARARDRAQALVGQRGG